MKSKRVFEHFRFTIIPSIYFVAYWIIGSLKGPYYWTPNQDPDYHYLGNSLNIANLLAPQHIDHPGTPLQILGGVVLRTIHWIQSLFKPGIASLTEEVLTHPEFYLNAIYCTLLVLTTLILFAVGMIAFRLCRNLFFSLILQLTPFLTILSSVGLEPSRVAPETLLFCISQLLVLLLLYYLYTDQAAQSRWFPLSLGMLFGIGMATKVSFLPMLVFFLLIQGLSRKVLALVTAIGSFVIATLPIVTQYPRLFDWIFRLATHMSSYGNGKQGLVEWSKFSKRLSIIAGENPVFFWLTVLLTILCITSFLFGRSRSGYVTSLDSGIPFQKLWKVAGVTVLALWGQYFLMAIEGTQPRHLTAALGLMGLVIFLSTQLIGTMFVSVQSSQIDANRWYWWSGAIVLILSIAISVQQTDVTIAKIEAQTAIRRQDLQNIAQLYEQPEYRACFQTFNPRASRIESVLEQANRLANYHYSTILAQLYPQATFYLVRRKHKPYFDTYTASRIDPAPLFQQGNGCILMQINTLAFTGKILKKVEGVEPVYLGKVESLYKIQQP